MHDETTLKETNPVTIHVGGLGSSTNTPKNSEQNRVPPKRPQMTLNIDMVKSEMKQRSSPIKKISGKRGLLQRKDSMEQSLYGNEDHGSATQRKKRRRQLFTRLKRFKTLEFKATNNLASDLKENQENNNLNAVQGILRVLNFL